MFSKTILKTLGLCSVIVIILLMTQCTGRVAPAPELPKDILGISVGMNKDEAQKRLSEIGQLESEGRKTGNLWRLKDDSRYSHLAIAYDADNRIRFVTALVDKATVKERVRFSEIGDLEKAKKEIVEQNHRYVWEAAASDGKPAYIVNIYGDSPEYLTIYSLSKKVESGVPAKE